MAMNKAALKAALKTAEQNYNTALQPLIKARLIVYFNLAGALDPNPLLWPTTLDTVAEYFSKAYTTDINAEAALDTYVGAVADAMETYVQAADVTVAATDAGLQKSSLPGVLSVAPGAPATITGGLS